VPPAFTGSQATLTWSAVHDYGGTGEELTQQVAL
jgi:chaperone protein EcpD